MTHIHAKKYIRCIMTGPEHGARKGQKIKACLPDRQGKSQK